MLFNSIDFAIFLPIVFCLYWFVTQRHLQWQNALVVAASYVFYGWWNEQFLALIFISTLVDYGVGIALAEAKSSTRKKALLGLSLGGNLGLLGYFKYCNFFIDNFVTAYTFLFQPIDIQPLQIVLPVGISFYTFQTLSYTIDIYRNKIYPTRDFVAFAAFVGFFPQLVAGPIERASNLLPQFLQKRTFEYAKAVDGMRQILWGLFKKVVVADNCAVLADMVFENSDGYSGSTLLLGAIFFAFQIYGDFSGYSDIAIGTARLFGFHLKQNFAFPYFSRDIAEFWRRWHISLTSWFRDYVYIPLGGSRRSKWQQSRNILIVFLVSGFWHGANWTFIAWGVVNVLFFLPLLWLNRNRKHLNTVAANRMLPSIQEICQMALTFGLVVFGWIFFRAENIEHAWSFIGGICSTSLFTVPEIITKQAGITVFCTIILVIIEWLGRNDEHGFQNIVSIKSRFLRWTCYSVILFLIGMFMHTNQTPFIYFQF